MTDEENKRRSIDANVNFIKKNICDCKGEKSYVFISYKSDDWEIVLHDIVYRLVKEHGLNVYFDGSFDSHNALWTDQFQENMGDYKCKGVIAFFDDKYATSYATLMELLCSQARRAVIGKPDYPDGLPIVSVDLGKLTNITGEQGKRNTGLGVQTYKDGSVNVNAANEKKLFSDLFEELVDRHILSDARYVWNRNDRLNAATCSQIVRELKAYKKINENYYHSGMQLDGIVGSIKDACGPEVFSQVSPPEEKHPANTASYLSGDKHGSETVKRGDSITKPDSGKADGYVYSIFGKEYTAGSGEQGKLMFDAFAALIERYPDCADKLTQRTSVAKSKDVKAPGTKEAHPSYFRGFKEFVISGQSYLVGTSYEFSAKIMEIKGMFNICGADVGEFVLNGKPLEGGKKTDNSGKDDRQGTDDVEADEFKYVLWGIPHTARKMSDMMHDVFDLIAERYPDKIQEISDSDSVSSVAQKEDVDEKRLASNKLSYFRASREHNAGGKIYYVGTSYNRAQGIGQLERMLKICEGNADGFSITSSPEQTLHSGVDKMK